MTSPSMSRCGRRRFRVGRPEITIASSSIPWWMCRGTPSWRGASSYSVPPSSSPPAALTTGSDRTPSRRLLNLSANTFGRTPLTTPIRRL